MRVEFYLHLFECTGYVSSNRKSEEGLKGEGKGSEGGWLQFMGSNG